MNSKTESRDLARLATHAAELASAKACGKDRAPSYSWMTGALSVLLEDLAELPGSTEILERFIKNMGNI